MNVIKISGNVNGVNLSIPSRIYFNGGIEYFSRVVVGNCPGDFDFALKYLKKVAKKYNAKLFINNKYYF